MCDKQRPPELEIVHKLRHIDAMMRRKNSPPCHPPEGHPHGGKDGFSGFGAGKLFEILTKEERGLIQTRLASMLNIRPQSLSELLTRLEGDGFITREQSEEDKRQIVVRITDAGREHHTRMRAKHLENARSLLSPLTDEEKTTFIRLLDKILEADTNQTKE
ncbi:MAG: MarR family transcriptional regulator [Clostridia bacterium]|nr:MarR family transcriptional regulator [Clostridia bacterium]